MGFTVTQSADFSQAIFYVCLLRGECRKWLFVFMLMKNIDFSINEKTDTHLIRRNLHKILFIYWNLKILLFALLESFIKSQQWTEKRKFFTAYCSHMSFHKEKQSMTPVFFEKKNYFVLNYLGNDCISPDKLKNNENWIYDSFCEGLAIFLRSWRTCFSVIWLDF